MLMESSGTISAAEDATEADRDGASSLDRLVRRDQLLAVRHSLVRLIGINMLLSLASAIVAAHAGRLREGLIWFALSLVPNFMRISVCWATRGRLWLMASMSEMPDDAMRFIDSQLRRLSYSAALSGAVWAGLPVLCDGYTTSQTLFYLAVTCGITSGAATHGIAFARLPICFMTPTLLSTAACLLWVGGFDYHVLACTVLLYLYGLTRGVVDAEKIFRETSRLKAEANALVAARERAQASASEIADEMRRRATHDHLSALLNRAGFLQEADKQLADPTREHCLMLLDLDGFKSVNDVYGHQCGDRVLVEVSKRIASVCPSDGIVARFGGDEFAIFYEPATTRMPPPEAAARLIRVVAEPFKGFDTGRVGASVGIYQGAAISITQMLSLADHALYAAKSAGRNCFRSFDAALRAGLDLRRDCESDLFSALAEKVLELWYQPIVCRDGRAVIGLEALVRWRHPVHGWIPPGDIIAAAASAGLTDPLFRYILDEVCEMMTLLRERGLSTIRVSMNVSPREMAQVAVDQIVLEKLRALGLLPKMLEIEITEETVLDIDAVRAKLLELSQAGVSVALDDFGAGYSSLAVLRQLHADRIKIDRSLVTGLASSNDKKGLVEAVLSLGRALDIEVVAEGVETAEDLEALQALGCRLMQGYYIGRPAPRHEALQIAVTSLADAA